MTSQRCSLRGVCSASLNKAHEFSGEAIRQAQDPCYRFLARFVRSTCPHIDLACRPFRSSGREIVLRYTYLCNCVDGWKINRFYIRYPGDLTYQEARVFSTRARQVCSVERLWLHCNRLRTLSLQSLFACEKSLLNLT